MNITNALLFMTVSNLSPQSVSGVSCSGVEPSNVCIPNSSSRGGGATVAAVGGCWGGRGGGPLVIATDRVRHQFHDGTL